MGGDGGVGVGVGFGWCAGEGWGGWWWGRLVVGWVMVCWVGDGV